MKELLSDYCLTDKKRELLLEKYERHNNINQLLDAAMELHNVNVRHRRNQTGQKCYKPAV